MSDGDFDKESPLEEVTSLTEAEIAVLQGWVDDPLDSTIGKIPIARLLRTLAERTAALRRESCEALGQHQVCDHLLDAVKEHHDQKADDRCWLDDAKLYVSFGLDAVDNRVGDKAAMLENCKRFIDRRCEGGHWPSYVELETQLAERTAQVAVIMGLLRAAYERGVADADAGRALLARLAAAEAEAERLRAALRNIVANARIQPDVSTECNTDIYAVPLDDIRDARAALAPPADALISTEREQEIRDEIESIFGDDELDDPDPPADERSNG